METKKMKNKKSLIAVIAIFIVTLVGVTIAYLQSTDTFENLFTAGKYKTVTTEEFESPTNWAPGDTTPKTIVTTNEGTMPVRVRVSFREEWKDENDQTLNLIYDGNRVALIDLANTDKWVYSDGYYYYKPVLAPNASTVTPLDSVTFNSLYDPTITCVESVDGKTHTCDSQNASYLGGTYRLYITTETVQADSFMDAWGLSVNPVAAPINAFEQEVELSDLTVTYSCTAVDSLDAEISYTHGTDVMDLIVPVTEVDNGVTTELVFGTYNYGSTDTTKIKYRGTAITDATTKANFEAFLNAYIEAGASDHIANTCINY